MFRFQQARLLVPFLFVALAAGCAAPRNNAVPSAAELQRLTAQAEQAIAAGDLYMAEKAYVTVVNADPKNGAAWFRLGTVYLRKGQPDFAQSSFEEALRDDPQLTKSHANIALSLLLRFRSEAVRAIASPDVADSNKEALQALLRDVDRSLTQPGITGAK